MFSIKTCQDCGVRFHKDYGQEVEGDYGAWYCEQHKKPYDLVFYHESGRSVYERVLEVSPFTGIPHGYVTDGEYQEERNRLYSRCDDLREAADGLKADLEAAQLQVQTGNTLREMDEKYIETLVKERDELTLTTQGDAATLIALRRLKKADDNYIKYLEGQLSEFQEKADKTKKRKG